MYIHIIVTVWLNENLLVIMDRPSSGEIDRVPDGPEVLMSLAVTPFAFYFLSVCLK